MEHVRNRIPLFCLALASLILAAEPIRWLVQSWQEPAYDSHGHWYVVALTALGAASVLSGPPKSKRAGTDLVLIFLAAAAMRLLGQVLAVNILAALALAVDVFAIATWLSLDRRRFALSPVWIAACFLFALPLAPLLERVLGFPLQRLSAELACQFLTPVFTDLVCDGGRLQVNGVDVLVDLPCSGASGLLTLLALWTYLNAIYRPALADAAKGLGFAILAALIGNGLRISLLAAGLAVNIDTMAPILHTSIGLAALALSALPLVLFYKPAARPPSHRPALRVPNTWLGPFSILALILSVAIVQAPKSPADRSGSLKRADLPAQLLGHAGTMVPLTDMERTYFAAYGGLAQKVSYGPMALNVVQTGSPLRHLHSPATCLRGMGFQVTFLGTRFDPIPTSIYRATAPDGQSWTVAVSFVSDQGDSTSGVGEAVWSWLTGRSNRWMSVQRITPTTLPPAARAAFEQAALAALDL